MTGNVHHIGPKGALELECIAEMESQALSQNAAGKRIGISGSALSQWLAGKYTGNIPAIEAKVRKWINTEREADKRSLAAAGLDIHRALGVTGEVSALLGHAQAVGDIVLVTGHSGAGKSWAAHHYCQTHSVAWYLEMSRCVRSLSGMLGRVSRAIGAQGRYRSALEAEEAVIEHLRDRGALLVIDEAHHLPAALLDELRCIRDQAGCGLALVGNDGIMQTLRECPQIVGRIGAQLEKRKPAEADVATLVSGILGRRAGRREVKAAMAAATGPGGFHALRRMLARAWMISRTEGREAIAAEDLELASTGVVTEPEADEAMEATA